MIYFLQAGDDGPIKIGHSATERGVEVRRSACQTGCPWPVGLLKIIPGTRKDEARVHQHFAAHRLAGEWFTPTTELAALAGGQRSSTRTDLLVTAAFERGREVGKGEGVAWEHARLTADLHELLARYDRRGVAEGVANGA